MEVKMAVRIGDEAPDFTAETTEGKIRFHEWIGDKWAILFSHPKDFTPVCTTELGYMAKLKPEFDKRNTKIIGLSIDPVSDHNKWVNDIKETQGTAVNYPMIGDPDLHVAKLYDMIHPNASGGQRHDPLGVHDRPRQESEGDARLPDERGQKLRRGSAPPRLAAAERQTRGGDAGELEAGRGRDHTDLGVRRGSEEKVPARLQNAQTVSADRDPTQVA